MAFSRRIKSVLITACSILSYFIVAGFLLEIGTVPPFRYMNFPKFTFFFTIYGYITISHRDQLPVGLIAQLVEYCASIPEVVGSDPVQA